MDKKEAFGEKSALNAAAMSLKRKYFECRRLFKRKWCHLLLIACFLMGLVVTLANLNPHMEGATNEHYHGDRRNFFKKKHSADQKQGQQHQNEAGKGVIELLTDVQTVLKPGELGNFESHSPEIFVTGDPGEGGKPVQSDRSSTEVRNAMAEFGFNTFVSDKISLNRTIPDTRNDECKHWNYPAKLPSATVVVVFHNEGWSPLLRTVHSVLNRSPPELLKEVLMVDDFSEKEHLRSKLDKYIEQFQGKVRLLRNSDREGLIRSRSIGAENARGDVVIFLDAHCEVNANWLPPLLAPIAADRRTMTVPIIDGIDMYTWAYHPQYGYRGSQYFRGIFDWGLLYKETEIPQQEKDRRNHETEPFRSPTHAGGLFAIDKKWFAQLGYYDAGLLIWGGEQYELSFKKSEYEW